MEEPVAHISLFRPGVVARAYRMGLWNALMAKMCDACSHHTHCEEIDMCQTRVTGMSSSLLVWTPVDEEPEGQRVARGMVVGASVGPTRGPEDPPSHCPHQD
jgi:hypothetical protein